MFFVVVLLRAELDYTIHISAHFAKVQRTFRRWRLGIKAPRTLHVRATRKNQKRSARTCVFRLNKRSVTLTTPPNPCYRERVENKCLGGR